jgi:indole-3-glycerol phosphate synthase
MEKKTQGPTILDKIVAARRESIAHRKRVLPDVALKMAAQKQDPPRRFVAALSWEGCNVIAELKKASPSLGLIREDYDPAALAKELEAAGASALSVLTEEDFFQGSLADLKHAKKAVSIPVLRKDFIIDPWQVWESRAAGADSFLLIVALLNDELLTELLELGRELGMEPLVEVHSREELSRARQAGAKIIGVNNRDLRDFKVSLQTSIDLISDIPDGAIAVSESGLQSREDLRRLRWAGFDAFLIGERLMTQPKPGEALKEITWSDSDATTAGTSGD